MAGVPEYRIVDGESREVTAYTRELRKGRSARPRSLGEDVAAATVAPDLTAPIGEVWP